MILRMRVLLLHTTSVLLYFAAALLLWRRLLTGAAFEGRLRALVLALATAAVATHAAVALPEVLRPDGLDLGLTSVVSLVSGVIAAMFVLGTLWRPIQDLGVVIMPLAGILITVDWIWPSPAVVVPHTSLILFLHLVVSILAYSLLSIGVAQSLLLTVQERRLHQKSFTAGVLRAAPPVETMEHLMFQLIGVGFVLLTATLVTGIFFSEQLFGRPLVFTHHIVLSVIAWGVFAVLLFGRLRFGWRGRIALRWAVSGFALLVLAYFGSKFVLEVILGRHG